MDFKLLGSILLIVGTSIGAGMLALPIATAQLGFMGSLILLIVCWMVMTAGAFLILEVTLWLPTNSNMISMAKATLGPIGQIIAWLNYFLLLYSLLCAYTAGGSDLFHSLLASAHLFLPRWVATFAFILVFASIVYKGIRTIDYANRGLMFVKFAAYFLLVICIAPLVSKANLLTGDMKQLNSITAITVTITSFGYATIIPSLRIYFASDVRKLKTAILIGGLIPLICYIIWDAIIMGVIPLQGEHGLIAMSHSTFTSSLVDTLSYAAASQSISFFIKLFTSICVLTSFLGVSLCLVDFMADGLQQEKAGLSGVFIHLLVFLPPLAIVLFYPQIFVKALEYAGIYSIILLVLLPAWMVWRGRYHHHLANGFKLFGGRGLLFLLMAFSIAMIGVSVVK